LPALEILRWITSRLPPSPDTTTLSAVSAHQGFCEILPSLKRGYPGVQAGYRQRQNNFPKVGYMRLGTILLIGDRKRVNKSNWQGKPVPALPPFTL
jgi:hypothetical protein